MGSKEIKIACLINLWTFNQKSKYGIYYYYKPYAKISVNVKTSLVGEKYFVVLTSGKV